MVGNEERAIVDALNEFRRRRTYVFATGGIGPTHGDITADCVAKAFGVPIDTDPRALAILHEWVKTIGAEMNEARLRMTRIPKGADLILNKVLGAPGFWIGNVIVMAGVPRSCRRCSTRWCLREPRPLMGPPSTTKMKMRKSEAAIAARRLAAGDHDQGCLDLYCAANGRHPAACGSSNSIAPSLA